MEILRCPNGHFYDPSQTPTCPKCAQDKRIDVDLDGSSVTMPVTEAAFNSLSDFGTTEPIIPAGAFVPADTLVTEPTRPSEAVVKSYPATEPISGAPVQAPAAPKVQAYNPTQPVNYGSKPNTDPLQPKTGFKPVVGWLVCVDGNNKGSDYRISNGYNYIGRAQSMDICIPGDMHISNENAAIVAYDDMERLFYFGPGMGHNAVRINGKMCLGQVQLNAYDEITMGETKLVFVPLCGERFDWNDRK